MKLQKSLGFTLIELLIVVAVLSILVIGLVVAINPVRQLEKARDSRRKVAITQLKRSLENYRALNTSYPSPGSWVNSTEGANWLPNLVSSGELRTLPVDPENIQTGGLPWSDPSNYAIYYLSNSYYDGGGPNCGANSSNFFLLSVHLENPSDPLAGNMITIGNGSSGCTYSLPGWYTVSATSNP